MFPYNKEKPPEIESLKLETDKVRVFPCPHCGEYINTEMNSCKFCHTPIAPQQAAQSADLQDKIAQACNEASLIRIAAFIIPVLFAFFCFSVFASQSDRKMLRIVDQLFGLLVIGTPLAIGHWFSAYNGLPAKDPDYFRAQRNVFISIAIWLPIAVVASYLWLQSQ